MNWKVRLTLDSAQSVSVAVSEASTPFFFLFDMCSKVVRVLVRGKFPYKAVVRSERRKVCGWWVGNI